MMRKRIRLMAVAVALVCVVVFAINAEKIFATGAAGYHPEAENYYITETNIGSVPNTFEAWIKLDNVAATERNGVVMGNYGTNASAIYSVEVFAGRHPRLLISDATGANTQSYLFKEVVLPTETEVYLAMVRDVVKGEVRCYVDGALMGTLSLQSPQGNTLNSAVALGADFREDNKMYFKGSISKVLLFTDVKTKEDIQSNMSTVNASGALAYWSFGDEGAIVESQGIQLRRDLTWFGNPAEYNNDSYAFTLAVIGDTQYLTDSQPDTYKKMYQWLIDNKESKKIQAVLGIGDITEHCSDDEWALAKEAATMMENAGLPYTLALGNHDHFDGTGDKFDQTFPASHFADKDYVAEKFGDNMRNVMYRFTLDGQDYLVFSLDYGANDEVLNWACGLIENNSQARVIITTHAYIYGNHEYFAGEFVNEDTSIFGCPAPTAAYGSNNGDDIWEKLISKYDNIDLTICGHVEGEMYVTKRANKNGNLKSEIVCDFNSTEKQENAGFVLLLHFSEDHNTVTTELISTNKNQYYKSKYQTSFTL